MAYEGALMLFSGIYSVYTEYVCESPNGQEAKSVL